jgi:diacylglycerol kinase family enzyme
MLGIGLVYNPRAGGNRRDPDAPRRLAKQLGDRGVVAVPRSLDELSRTAEDFHRQNIRVLGIAGGDGTNHVTLTGFADVYGETPLPTVALLRGGTMNTVANSLRLPKGKPEGLLDRLILRCVEGGELSAVERPTMRIGKNLGFLFGTGVIPGYLKEYYETGSPSPTTAVKTLARACGSAAVSGAMIQRMTAPVEAEVTADGATWERRSFITIAAGTITDIGLGFHLFHRALERDDAMHLIGIHATAFECVKDLPRIFRSKPMRAGKATDALVRTTTIRTRDGKSLAYTIDGDLLEQTDGVIELGIGPRVRIATMRLGEESFT